MIKLALFFVVLPPQMGIFYELYYPLHTHTHAHTQNTGASNQYIKIPYLFFLRRRKSRRKFDLRFFQRLKLSGSGLSLHRHARAKKPLTLIYQFVSARLGNGHCRMS